MGRCRFASLGCLLFLLTVPVALHAQVTNGSVPVFFPPSPMQTAGPIARATTPSLRLTAAPRPDTRAPATFVPLEDVTRRPAALVPLYAGMIGLQAYDVYSTLAAIKKGAVEVNPMTSAAVQQPVAFAAIKGVAAATTMYAAERLWRKDRRKSAIALLIVTNGMLAVAAAKNASVLRAQR